MKRFAVTMIAVAYVMRSVSSLAGDLGTQSIGERLANRDCAWCHGQSGQGFSTAPRLAGQTKPYIESQLTDLKFHKRDNPKSEQFMWGVAYRIDSERAADLASYFAALPAVAAEDGNRSLADAGAVTYRDGRIESNIPSCVACHGPNAEGRGAIPRLGGLSYRYLKRRLAQWGEGYHLAAKAPMPEIAKILPPADIEAIASYLSFVK